MKPIFLLSVLLVVLQCAAIAQDLAPVPKVCVDDGSRTTFFTPRRASIVTIESSSGTVSVLEFPEGVFLSFDWNIRHGEHTKSENGARHTFSGDLKVRARRADELVEGESLSAKDIMSKAPFGLELSGAKVVVKFADG